MLMVSTLNAEEVASRGIPVLDLYLLMQAEKQKKRVHAIEQPDEHCDPLNDLGLDMVSFEKTAAFSVASHFGLSFISNIV